MTRVLAGSALAAVPVLVAAPVLALLLLASRPASACGGFACDSGLTEPPVQDAERIVFAIDDGPAPRTTATVQISYSGRAESFAWIVPLTAVPEGIEVADPALFDELELATAPTFVQQSSFSGGDTVGGGDSGGLSFGCGCDDELAASPGGAVMAGSGGEETAQEVTVYSQEQVGPYSTVVVGAEDATALGLWLQENGFDLPVGADALLATYVEEDATFLAVKLVPGADTRALQPLRFTYVGAPCLPLRLTAISTADVLPVQVYVAAAHRAIPADWVAGEPDYDGQLLISGGSTNYQDVVDQLTGELGGHAWVTEYAGGQGLVAPGGPAAEALAGLPYLTRLYARVPRAALDRDPHFSLDAAAPDVSNFHLLAPLPAPTRGGVGFGPATWLLAGLAGWLLSRRGNRR